jgi:hypothetical protein
LRLVLLVAVLVAVLLLQQCWVLMEPVGPVHALTTAAVAAASASLAACLPALSYHVPRTNPAVLLHCCLHVLTERVACSYCC